MSLKIFLLSLTRYKQVELIHSYIVCDDARGVERLDMLEMYEGLVRS